MEGSLYIISAASGVGKTSLVSKLLKLDSHIKVSISTTTRPIRKGEVDGENYHFIDIEEFNNQIASHDFLEHAQVFDNFYGTSKIAVENTLKTGKDIILEIDWQGAQQVRQIMPEAISIFILPPSLTELHNRLTKRGTDSQEIIDQRMSEAINEMKHYAEFNYLIINNNFEVALQAIHTIFVANRLNINNQITNHRSLIDALVGK